MSLFNINTHQNSSSYVCFCCCSWCGMAQVVFKAGMNLLAKGALSCQQNSKPLAKRGQTSLVLQKKDVGMGLGQCMLTGLHTNVFW